MSGSPCELDAGCSLFVVLGVELSVGGKVDEGGVSSAAPGSQIRCALIEPLWREARRA